FVEQVASPSREDAETMQMTSARSTGSPAPERRRSGMAKPLRWIGAALKRIGQFLLIAWGTLAIYYSNLPWAWARIALAAACAAFGVWALWVRRRIRLFAGVFAAVVVWWILIPPSLDRPWRPDHAVLARAIIDGDHVRLKGFRNFHYRSVDDFDSHWEER